MKLAVAMIAHNEAQVIGRALTSVEWADQVVVLDCESSDDTPEIAKRRGAEVYSVPNDRNLNINKNRSIAYCKADWILVLDADEAIPYDLAGEIRRIVNSPDSLDGYFIPRKNFILGKWARYGSQYPDYQLRLFRNGKGRFPAKHVHEKLKIEGKTGKISLPFEHHPYPTLESIVRKNQRDFEFEARYLYENGKRVTTFDLARNLLFNIPFRFVRRFVFKRGFLDGARGLMMVWFDAANNAQRLFRLWELNKNRIEAK